MITRPFSEAIKVRTLGPGPHLIAAGEVTPVNSGPSKFI